MPEAVSAQNTTTVPLSAVNPPEEKKPSFFDRTVGKLVGFIAKATGQPDPITGARNGETLSVQQSGAQVVNPQMPVQEQAPQEPGFFQKLVASTQNLLNKTSSIANSITTTTSSIAGKITEKTNAVAGAITTAPNMVANQATNLINKGVDMGGQLKDSIQSNAQHLAGNVQNFASNPVGGVQNFVSDPMAGMQNIGNQMMQGGQQVMASAQQMGGQVMTGVQNAGIQIPIQMPDQSSQVSVQVLTEASIQEPQQVAQDQQSLEQTSPQLASSQGNPVESIFAGIRQGASTFVEKTKGFVQNPVESIDAFAGSGAENVSVPTETVNTTSLDQLQLSNSEQKSESVPVQL